MSCYIIIYNLLTELTNVYKVNLFDPNYGQQCIDLQYQQKILAKLKKYENLAPF
jgi:hypothetical protein